MSNRPPDDFRFDDDDDFPFDNDDDTSFDGGLGDDFDEDLPALEEEEEPGGRGPSRTFIVIAALMIILFLVAIVALIFLANRDTGPTPFEITSTAIAQINATTIAQGFETQTQAANLLLTETQIAFNATLTAQAPTDTPSPSPSPTIPTATPTPTLDATLAAATAIQLQTEAALTQAAALPILEIGDVPIERIRQAATAVALIFQAEIQRQGGGVPDIEATSTAIAEVISTQVFGEVIEPSGPVVQAVTPVAQILQTAIVIPGGIGDAAIQATSTAVANLLQTEIALPSGNVPAPQVALAATAIANVLQAAPAVVIAPEAFQATSTAVASGLQEQAEIPGAGIIGIVAQAATPAAGIFQTEIAFTGQLDPTAVQLTSTAVADIFATALAGQGGGQVSIDAVAQTATALANLLQQPTQAGVITPTPEGGTPSFQPRPTELPDTGLFDDIAAGSPAGLGAIVLTMMGLIAVIVISRRLRAINK